MIQTPLFEYMCHLGNTLQLQRFNVSQEKQTQLEVEEFLLQERVLYERKKRLSEHDIPDFMILSDFGKIVVEVKTRYQKRAIRAGYFNRSSNTFRDGVVTNFLNITIYEITT